MVQQAVDKRSGSDRRVGVDRRIGDWEYWRVPWIFQTNQRRKEDRRKGDRRNCVSRLSVHAANAVG